MNEILLINVSGRDRPGLTASLSSILAQYDVTILDIGQAVIHNTLSLGFLVQVDGASESGVLKDMVFRAYELDVDIHFTPIPEADYGTWVAQQQSQRYIITLLGPRITAAHIASVAEIVATNGLNIDDISRLSRRMPVCPDAAHDRVCVQLGVRGQPADPGQMRSDFLHLSTEQDIDVAFQVDDVYRRNRRLVALDMDSTLVQCEVIDELAAAFGVESEVAAITEQAIKRFPLRPIARAAEYGSSFTPRNHQYHPCESRLRTVRDPLPIKNIPTVQSAGPCVFPLKPTSFRW